MAPTKKREKDTAPVANGNSNSTSVSSANANLAIQPASDAAKLNGHLQEQELFLQAFEKPTQIYRFLRNRHGTSPIFLNRTLSYMKDRMSRNNKKRATFKVSSLLNTIFEKNEPSSNKYLNIVFNGLFKSSDSSNHSWWNDGDVICVESTLFKITKSKRKDSTSDFQEILKHSTNIVYNPHKNIGQYSGINIPLQAMMPLGDHHIIYKLLFRIKMTASEDEENQGESEAKRLKFNKLYGCELNIFERNVGAIPEGDYEVAMREISFANNKSFSPKKRTWETLPMDNAVLTAKFDAFKLYPTLKFRLSWSKTEVPATITSMDLFKFGGNIENGSFNGLANGNIKSSTDTQNDQEQNSAKNNHEQINHNNNCIKSSSVNVKREKIQIIYNFLYSNNTRQQTEYTQEVICPWCGLDCLRLYALLKHLKLCHARFNFTYQPAGNGARIDVTINDSYDGSYAGSPYDLAGPAGCSFARTCGPVRRTSVTNLLVCRPRRLKTGLDEFLVLDEDELSNQRPYITGHNRLYHHTETCLPVHPKELGIDSEGESDPLWLRQKTIQMIDEFSDVNEGEKELMKLWNLHVMKHGYVGDCQLPLACEMFLDANGHEIIRKNLYRNFILHLSSLFDYGLISPEIVYKTIQKLQAILSKYREGQDMMSQQHTAQLKYWHEIGVHKQVEQKLKLPQKHSNLSSDRQNDRNLEDLPTPKRMTAALKLAINPTQSDVVSVTKNSASKSAGRPNHSQVEINNESTEVLRERKIGVGNTKKDLLSELNAINTEKNHSRKTAKKTALAGANQNNIYIKDRQRSDSLGSSRRNSNSNSIGTDTLPFSMKTTDKMRSTETASLKRKLSTKDAQQQQQPNTKRIRPASNSINNLSSRSLSTSTSTSTTRSASQRQDNLLRRRSVPLRKSSIALDPRNPEKNVGKSGLRTRVSLPHAKSEKR